MTGVQCTCLLVNRETQFQFCFCGTFWYILSTLSLNGKPQNTKLYVHQGCLLIKFNWPGPWFESEIETDVLKPLQEKRLKDSIWMNPTFSNSPVWNTFISFCPNDLNVSSCCSAQTEKHSCQFTTLLMVIKRPIKLVNIFSFVVCAKVINENSLTYIYVILIRPACIIKVFQTLLFYSHHFVFVYNCARVSLRQKVRDNSHRDVFVSLRSPYNYNI